MVLSAHDVAAELRRRLPGLPTVKLHKLLYYCQGHHLAAFGRPLFGETIAAWDMGPVVGELWKAEQSAQVPESRAELNEAQLNTIGYVVSRYGALSGLDLIHLTHSEMPWKRANASRRPKESTRIETAWLAEYFQAEYFQKASAEEADGDVTLDSGVVTAWLQGAEARRGEPVSPDSPERLLARITGG